MTIAVTGASGFIGREILAALDRAGMKAIALRREPRPGSSTVETRRLPAPDASQREFRTALEGVTHVVHCAGLTNAAPDTPEAAYFAANATLAGNLAEAAAAQGVSRFVLLSSIRAMVGAGFDGTIALNAPPAPDDAYGRSKLSGERAVQAAFATLPGQATVLRLPPVYGPGMKGNLEKLMRLADTPWPLPLDSIGARRTLVGADGVAEIVVALVGRTQEFRPVYLVGDRKAASLPQILAAFRKGLNRPARLFPAPQPMINALARLAGASAAFDALAASQISDVEALVQDGLPLRAESTAGLSAVARAWVSAGRRWS